MGGYNRFIPARSAQEPTTDKSDLDLDVIYGFLSQSYWAMGNPRDLVARSIQNTALCFGIYAGDAGRDDAYARPVQVGFVRVFTDRLYAQHGFAPPEQPGLFMEIAPGPTVYLASLQEFRHAASDNT